MELHGDDWTWDIKLGMSEICMKAPLKNYHIKMVLMTWFQLPLDSDVLMNIILSLLSN